MIFSCEYHCTSTCWSNQQWPGKSKEHFGSIFLWILMWKKVCCKICKERVHWVYTYPILESVLALDVYFKYSHIRIESIGKIWYRSNTTKLSLRVPTVYAYFLGSRRQLTLLLLWFQWTVSQHCWSLSQSAALEADHLQKGETPSQWDTAATLGVSLSHLLWQDISEWYGSMPQQWGWLQNERKNPNHRYL